MYGLLLEDICIRIKKIIEAHKDFEEKMDM
jgi:hypothetical protein